MNDIPVVIVTGASRGLGAAVADCLNRLGVSLVMVARSEAALERAAASLDSARGRMLMVCADVADPTECRNAVAQTLQHYGAVHALINNAGIVGPMASIERADVLDWKYNIEVNLLGPFYMTHYSLPALRKTGGRIVNVSSGAANHSIIAASAYCAAKAGLTHFTRVLADEESGITAVAVRPGVVDTPMQEKIRREGPAAMPPEQAEYYHALKRTGRLEPPIVPARAISWLALEAPRTWTGRFLNYDDPTIVEGVRQLFRDL